MCMLTCGHTNPLCAQYSHSFERACASRATSASRAALTCTVHIVLLFDLVIIYYSCYRIPTSWSCSPNPALPCSATTVTRKRLQKF
eukprot:5840974-Amphidinium_carterae.1